MLKKSRKMFTEWVKVHEKSENLEDVLIFFGYLTYFLCIDLKVYCTVEKIIENELNALIILRKMPIENFLEHLKVELKVLWV